MKTEVTWHPQSVLKPSQETELWKTASFSVSQMPDYFWLIYQCYFVQQDAIGGKNSKECFFSSVAFFPLKYCIFYRSPSGSPWQRHEIKRKMWKNSLHEWWTRCIVELGVIVVWCSIDGGPPSALGRLQPLFRTVCQLWAPCESLMLLQCCAPHIIVSQGQTRQEREASGVGNMKDKFVLDATDQEMIV